MCLVVDHAFWHSTVEPNVNVLTGTFTRHRAIVSRLIDLNTGVGQWTDQNITCHKYKGFIMLTIFIY